MVGDDYWSYGNVGLKMRMMMMTPCILTPFMIQLLFPFPFVFSLLNHGPSCQKIKVIFPFFTLLFRLWYVYGFAESISILHSSPHNWILYTKIDFCVLSQDIENFLQKDGVKHFSLIVLLGLNLTTVSHFNLCSQF